MKRNNKDNPGYGKGGNYKTSQRNERPDRENRSSSGGFFPEHNTRSDRSGKPAFNKTTAHREDNSERRNRSSSDYGRGRGERSYREGSSGRDADKRDWSDPDRRRQSDTYGNERSKNSHRTQNSFKKYGHGGKEKPYSGSKAPYKKFGSDAANRSGEGYSYGKSRTEKPNYDKKSPDKRFGSEWADKGGEKPSHGYAGSDRKERTSENKPSFNQFEKDREKADGTQYKTLYKGRGRDQKPRYEAVKREEVDKNRSSKKFFSKNRNSDHGPKADQPVYDFDKYGKNLKKETPDEKIRLNKYIANSGVCSRREADALIENGLISVNGAVVKELGHKVNRDDHVAYQGRRLNPEQPVYLLLNKPKDFITTTDDPLERKTVMSLVSSACDERIFPVGRLDRNTTGLLLFTNDGELADKLASPANKIKKIYQVTLDKPLTKNDAETILEGLTLEDGPVKVDDMQVLSLDRTILGLEIHVGRNRIVRRIFAHLGYDVGALDRVVYAGLTKKDLSRGDFRFLSEKEVINLKFFK